MTRPQYVILSLSDTCSLKNFVASFYQRIIIVWGKVYQQLIDAFVICP